MAAFPFVLDLSRQPLTIFRNFSQVMTNKDYQALRESLGTQTSVAKRLGVAERTIQRRENGGLKITREAEAAMRLLYDACKSFGGLSNLTLLISVGQFLL
jgi:DNA-binding XRE family transcriptional regulator